LAGALTPNLPFPVGSGTPSKAAFTKTKVRVWHCMGPCIRVLANTSLRVSQCWSFTYLRVRVTCKFHAYK